MILKEPKTYEEQMQLIQSKGFIIENEQECIAFLEKVNYYRLSAYFLPFRKKDNSYFQNIKFSKIQKIYEFDNKIRSLLFQTIEEIEVYLRTQLSYYSGHTYGSLGYLDNSHFSPKHDSEKFAKMVEKCIDENSRTLVVKHHNKNYDGKFPIWVIIEFFSLGTLSYFFSDLNIADQKKLAKEMYATSPKNLGSWLHCITVLRNRCAHYSRLYYYLFPVMPRFQKKNYYTADRTLFTQLLVLKYLFPNKDIWNKSILPKIEGLVNDYLPDISLKHIGFPESWQSILSTEENHSI